MVKLLKKFDLTNVVTKFQIEKITPDIVGKLSLTDFQCLGITNRRIIMDLRVECAIYGQFKPTKICNSNGGAFFLFRTYLTCLACKSSGIYPVDCFQQGARTSRFGAKPPAPQFYKVATTSR